ncbi:MAG TPA: class I SAM-dependent methyltransferase [Vicinamibacterales bacterium]|nr:class I SAM-dependent methyltransferase [Vicinamibacterales bacterium]
MADAITLPPRLAEYVRLVSVKESDVQRRLREETAARPDASMLTSPEQAQFLALLVRILGARRCLEIGVYTGYTSIFLAQALPAGGRVVGCDVDEKTTSSARRYWREAGVEHKIDLRIAPALDTLDALLREGASGSFDLVYIDADKRGYADYYERSLALVRRGGVIAADNVLRRGDVASATVNDTDTVAIRSFNERLRDDERVAISLLPMRDGLTLAWKK